MYTVAIRSEIEILREELQAEKRKLERLKRQSGPSGIGSGTSYVDADAIHADHHKEAMTELQEILRCRLVIDAIENEIEELKGSLKRIEEHVASLDGVDKKVVVLRDVDGKSLGEIADELGYSESWIKKVSARNPKQ